MNNARTLSSHFLVLALLLASGLLASGCTPNKASNSNPNAASNSNQNASAPSPVTLLNVSYDPTREFYQEFNESFAAQHRKATGQVVTIEQSHGGSGKQARAVIDGLGADVVTLALAYDIDAIADKSGLIPENWQQRLPHNSSPYTSTIVFLVRKGNPKQIKDWDDLIKGDVSVITPNPKTSGGARWNYLAAWGFALKKSLGDWSKLKDPTDSSVIAAQAEARAFVGELFKRVPVLDSGARGATNTFIQREIGDVLLTWENEAHLAIKDAGSDKVEIVVPKQSILAEPPVSIVDGNAKKHGTEELAKEYLEYLYSPTGQILAAKHFYRPVLTDSVDKELLQPFTSIDLFTVDEAFGGWTKAQPEHFDDGGVFDQLYQPGN